MKKVILTLFLAIGILTVKAQEKGLYLTGSGSIGMNYFNYTLPDNSKSTPQLGYGAALGVQYYFTYHWGLATGIGLTHYNTKGNFSASWEKDPSHYAFEGMDDQDSDPGSTIKTYTLQLGVNDWTETQQAYFLEVPLMLMYQTKWGQKESFGMYFGVGAKAQIPVFGKEYKVEDESELQVLGYYAGPNEGFTLGYPYSQPEFGFGTTAKTGYKGDLELKTGFAASAEIGFLINLSRRVDLTLGGYLDYGFTNINKNSGNDNNLVEPENGAKTIHPSNYIGDHLQYNGYMNSYAVDKVNAIAYGGKIGLRVKLGKLKERKEPKTDTCYNINETHTSSKDSIFIIYMPPVDTTRRQSESQPNTSRVQPTDDELRVLFEPIFFDLDQSKLLPASVIILNRKAAIMERYPRMQLLITGNTCDLASDIYNLKLGERRANAAKVYLETLGAGKNRISVVSQSFHHPMMPNIDETNREKNRRCDFYPTGY